MIFIHSNITPDAPPNAPTSDGSSSGTSAGESQCPAPTQPPYTPARSPSARPFAPAPRTNEESEPEREGSRLPASSARNDKCVYLKHPVLSHMNPRRGSTNGGEEIYLIVRNLPPTTKPYARFGANITPTVRSLIPQNAMNELIPRP